jgi:hypothetical protein
MAGRPRTRAKEAALKKEQKETIQAELPAPTDVELDKEFPSDRLKNLLDATEGLDIQNKEFGPSVPSFAMSEPVVPVGKISKSKEEERLLEQIAPSAIGVLFHKETDEGAKFIKYAQYDEISRYSSPELYVTTVLAPVHGGGRYFETLMLSDGKRKRLGDILIDREQFKKQEEVMDAELRAMLTNLQADISRKSQDIEELRKLVVTPNSREPQRSTTDKLLEFMMTQRMLDSMPEPKSRERDIRPDVELERRLRILDQKIDEMGTSKDSRRGFGGPMGIPDNFPTAQPAVSPELATMMKDMFSTFQGMIQNLISAQQKPNDPNNAIQIQAAYDKMMQVQQDMGNKLSELQQKMTDQQLTGLYKQIDDLREDVSSAMGKSDKDNLDTALDAFEKVQKFQEILGVDSMHKKEGLATFMKGFVDKLPAILSVLGPMKQGAPQMVNVPIEARPRIVAPIQKPEEKPQPQPQIPDTKPASSQEATDFVNVTDAIASLKDSPPEEMATKISEFIKDLWNHPVIGPQIKLAGLPERLTDVADFLLTDAIQKNILTSREASRIMAVVESGRVDLSWIGEPLVSQQQDLEHSPDSSISSLPPKETNQP